MATAKRAVHTTTIGPCPRLNGWDARIDTGLVAPTGQCKPPLHARTGVPGTALKQQQNRHHHEWHEGDKQSLPAPPLIGRGRHQAVQIILNAIDKIQRQTCQPDQHSDQNQTDEMANNAFESAL